MNDFIGLGVAGNFTEHLEQAGEANDFKDVKVEHHKAPKGIFPWYVPSVNSFLSIDPSSSSMLLIPKGVPVQAEPELVLICDLTYGNDQVVNVEPVRFGVFNDASLRIDQPKISKKKNWGKNSQGISAEFLPIDSFTDNGILTRFILGSWHRRNGKWRQYGEASEVRFYSYFYSELIDWLIVKMNNQHDHGPLEDISELLRQANNPTQAYIAVGSTRYTAFGETTYLEDGDEVAIVLFDEKQSPDSIMDKLQNNSLESTDSCVYLRQTVKEVKPRAQDR
ncbi:MAG TPA: DUF5718 family protein [Candidatus Saccharimonadales bacterium]